MRVEYARLAGLQCAITITGSTLVCLVVTHLAAGSVAYGGGIALVSTLWLAMRLAQAERQENSGAERSLRHAYRTVLERFAWVFLLFAAGLRLMELAPLWLLVGFVAGQSAWLLAPVWKR
ncbi:MAG: ATP synthase subunit I [Nitrosomonadales bacterium]|nr:ATP synthase subunit I [Nitrosomonadales bacterium]